MRKLESLKNWIEESFSLYFQPIVKLHKRLRSEIGYLKRIPARIRTRIRNRRIQKLRENLKNRHLIGINIPEPTQARRKVSSFPQHPEGVLIKKPRKVERNNDSKQKKAGEEKKFSNPSKITLGLGIVLVLLLSAAGALVYFGSGDSTLNPWVLSSVGAGLILWLIGLTIIRSGRSVRKKPDQKPQTQPEKSKLSVEADNSTKNRRKPLLKWTVGLAAAALLLFWAGPSVIAWLDDDPDLLVVRRECSRVRVPLGQQIQWEREGELAAYEAINQLGDTISYPRGPVSEYRGFSGRLTEVCFRVPPEEGVDSVLLRVVIAPIG